MEESKRKENNIHSKEQHKYSTFFCSTFASHTHTYIYLYLSSPSMNPPTSPTEAILFSTCFLCALKGSWGGGGSFCIERLSMNVPFDRYHTKELVFFFQASYIVKEIRCIHLTNLYSLCEQVARSSTPSTKQKLNQLKLFSKKEKLYPHISK